MFKIKTEEFVNKTFRLNKELVEELSECATENNISLNALVAQCCRYALDNIVHDSKMDNKDNHDAFSTH